MSKVSRTVVCEKLPRLSALGAETLVIYDKVLFAKYPKFKKWLLKSSASYGVDAGEKLKGVENFSTHILNLTALAENLSSRNLTIVVVGGGSVGDFGGFVASVFKRGVKLVHVPSTWLAAIDSAHGGKTGLNVGGVKNQIGTFYPAEKVYLVRELLQVQPEARAFEAFGELLKIAWIIGGPLWTSLSREKTVSSKVIWKYLPQAIRGKYQIVARDPREENGLRHILNLGHTVGHVFEAYHELPHGIAINYGLQFAMEWSAQKGIMKKAVYEQLLQAPILAYLLSPLRDDLLASNEAVLKKFAKLLANDKKKTKGSTLRFVFLERPGKVLIREVTVDEVLVEICRQKESELYG